MAWAGGRHDALYAQSAALMETSPAGSQESFARRPCEARAAAGVEGKAAPLPSVGWSQQKCVVTSPEENSAHHN